MVSKIYATMANDKTDIAMVEDSIHGSSGILHQSLLQGENEGHHNAMLYILATKR